MYVVINKFTGEEFHKAETIRGCREWITMGDLDDWGNYVIVDSNGTPVEWQVKPPRA